MKQDIDHRKKEQTEKEILLRRIEPGDKATRVFEDNKLYIDSLATFVKDGLNAGDIVVVIATEQHLSQLEVQLRAMDFDIFYLTQSKRAPSLPNHADSGRQARSNGKSL